jgi:hypothetical protein
LSVARAFSRIRVAAALVMTVLAAPVAGAQNLLLNPDFDADLGRSGWLDSGTWVAEDWLGEAGSGSLRVTNSFAGTAVVQARQCVAVGAGQHYAVAGVVRAAPGQFAGMTTAAVSVGWWSQPGCAAGSGLGVNAVGTASQTGAWERLGPTALAAPVGAASADVRLQAFKSDGAGAFAAFFDAMTLPEPGPASAGLAAVAALLVLDRRKRERRSHPRR